MAQQSLDILGEKVREKSSVQNQRVTKIGIAKKIRSAE